MTCSDTNLTSYISKITELQKSEKQAGVAIPEPSLEYKLEREVEVGEPKAI
jgi:hypothetical protein